MRPYGVAAPRAANNSSVQTSLIPRFTLDIPFDPVMAENPDIWSKA